MIYYQKKKYIYINKLKFLSKFVKKKIKNILLNIINFNHQH